MTPAIATTLTVAAVAVLLAGLGSRAAFGILVVGEQTLREAIERAALGLLLVSTAGALLGAAFGGRP